MYATDDRYTDDCHYTPSGNMRMYYDVGTYGGNMVAMKLRFERLLPLSRERPVTVSLPSFAVVGKGGN